MTFLLDFDAMGLSLGLETGTKTDDLKISEDKDEKVGFSCYSDLESLTTRQLRLMARQANIQGSRTMSKPQLIEALRAEAEKTKQSAQ